MNNDNMAIANPPLPATNPPAELIASSEYGHHDDAWRSDYAAWRWTLPDIGPAVCVRIVDSWFPHEPEERTVMEMVIPIEFMKSIMDATGGA